MSSEMLNIHGTVMKGHRGRGTAKGNSNWFIYRLKGLSTPLPDLYYFCNCNQNLIPVLDYEDTIYCDFESQYKNVSSHLYQKHV